jgi:murein tripeptide amidase MpaA
VLTFGYGPKVVIIVGRVHPGESHSSWVLHGLMSYLSQSPASSQLTRLKELLTFKVVPMINVDGVVGGNYRTSFIGKDMNRLYLQDETDTTKVNKLLIPEITAIKNLVLDNKK